MILRLTADGIKLIDSLESGMGQASEKILAPLTDDEREDLRNLLKRIV